MSDQSPFPAMARIEPMAILIPELFWDRILAVLAAEVVERARTGEPPHTIETASAARQAALAAYTDALLPAGNA